MQQIKNRFSYWASHISPTKFFVLTAACFGLLFLFITPPFQGADEEVHFYRAYQISEGNFVVDQIKGGSGGSLPASLGKVVKVTDSPAIQFYPQLKYYESRTRQALSVKLNPSIKKTYNFTAAAQNSPVAYIASSAGILVGRILHVPSIVLLYLARLADLILWILLVGFAIYFLPRKKWAFAALGLLPMAIFQAATLNVDVITVGSIALFLALILNYKEKKKTIGYKQIVFLLMLATVMVLSKQIMFIFLPLIFLIKNDSFKTARLAYITKIITTAVPLFCTTLWFMVVHSIDVASAYANHQDPHAQIKFIAKNPFSFLNVMWNNYFYTWGDSITRSFIGVFGWADGPLSESIATIGYIGLAFLVFTSTSATDTIKSWLSRRQKLLLTVIFGAYLVVLSAGFYVYNSPVGFKIIIGLQGRYFLPAAFIILPVISSGILITKQKIYKRIALGLPIFLLTASLITIYVRYFVNNV